MSLSSLSRVRSFFSFNLEPISFLIYFGSFFWCARKVNGRFHYWAVTFYYLLATIIITRASLRLESDTSNNHYYNLLYPITSIGLAFYFFSILHAQWKKIIAILTGLTTLIYYFANLDEVFFDSIGHVITSVGIVLLIFLYLHQLMNNVTEKSLSYNFDFWYICIQLMYHLGSFAIFLSYNHFTYRFLAAGDDKKATARLLAYLWIVHNIILFMGALVTAYAVARIYKKKIRLT